jgi:RNA polymerase sigma-70 factor (ECF subfamily)
MAAEGIPGAREKIAPRALSRAPFPAGRREGLVSRTTEAVNQSLEQFRVYLETLAFIQIDPRLRGKFGWSDIIQGTLIEATRILERIEAMDPEDQRPFLRRMLLNNLRDEIDHWRTQGYDVGREVSLDEAVEQSSCRVRDWIIAEESTPSKKLMEQEGKLRVLAAMSQLPQREREALSLQYDYGWKLAQIAEYLGCTMNVVAGLQARGRKRLRKLLSDLE